MKGRLQGMLYKTRLENGTIEILLVYYLLNDLKKILQFNKKEIRVIVFFFQYSLQQTQYALCYSLHNTIDYFVQLNYQLLRELI